MKHKYTVKRTPRFDKEVLRAEKRGLDTRELDTVVLKLRNDEQLERKYCDHPLKGAAKAAVSATSILTGSWCTERTRKNSYFISFTPGLTATCSTHKKIPSPVFQERAFF